MSWAMTWVVILAIWVDPDLRIFDLQRQAGLSTFVVAGEHPAGGLGDLTGVRIDGFALPAEIHPVDTQVPQYDWDAFWCEAAASLHMDGIPNTQAEMIRRMEAWFAARGQFPEKTTIRRKVSLLWRRIHQEAA